MAESDIRISPDGLAQGTSLNAPSITIAPETLNEQLVVGFSSSDPRSRAFNLLRTQLTKKMEKARWRLLGVTSATPGAGKTFTSVNLAAALSRMDGRKILLCDFDLRRGSIAKQLGVDVPVTLNDYLIGDTNDWRSAVYRINDGDLYILPSNGSALDSSEQLSGERFRQLIAELRELSREFIVVCDLAPVFANDDAMLCTQQLDAYLLVVHHGQTTGRQVQESIELLKPAICMGTVLNRYQGGIADEYGYGYGDPYGLKNYYRSES